MDEAQHQHGFGPTQVRQLRRQLLSWFAQVRRELPWRSERSGYRVWVSEVMLQQTRVSTVLRYYDRFLQMFPDLPALAAAPLDAVLTQWSGLGYYRRARMLHAGAQHVVAELDGELPQQAARLLQIPGVGPYTAGAIASLAYGERTPLVDGNVERVLCRLGALPDDPRRAVGKRALWSLAEQLVDPEQPGAFNEALMELGATLCSPRSPQCGACPWQSGCRAHALGEPLLFPRLPKRKPPRDRHVLYLVLLDGEGRLWLGQRPAEGRFAGLWEPPARELDGDSSKAQRSAAWRALQRELGVQGAPIAAGGYEHVLSHLRLAVEVKVCRVHAAQPPQRLDDYVTARWVAAGEAVGISRLATKAVELAMAACGLHPRDAQG